MPIPRGGRNPCVCSLVHQREDFSESPFSLANERTTEQEPLSSLSAARRACVLKPLILFWARAHSGVGSYAIGLAAHGARGEPQGRAATLRRYLRYVEASLRVTAGREGDESPNQRAAECG